jgi:hypothetical protein
MIRVRLGRQAAAATLALLLVSLAAAEPVASPPAEMFVHTARRGDTLEDLAASYLGNPQLWPVLARLNHIADPRKIPIGFDIRIPVDAMRSQPETARVIRIDGVATVVRAGSTSAAPLVADDTLSEGDVVRIPENSFVAIALGDGSIVHVQADTVLRMGTLRKLSATGASRAIFRLEKGRVDAVVKPVSTEGGRFDVATPLAVAGVRGTNFGVGVRADGASVLDVIGGVVAFGSGEVNGGARVTARMSAVISRSAPAPRMRAVAPGPNPDDLPSQIERAVVGLALPGLRPGAEVRVQISHDREMREVVQSRISDAKAVRFVGLDDGDYFLGVQTADAEGNMSRQSVVPVRLWLKPEPPVPLAPAANSKVAGGGLVLECSKVEGATVYDLQLSTTSGFEQLVAQSLGSAACRWELPTLPDGTYYWRATTVIRNSLGQMVRGPRGDAGDFVVSGH